MENFYKLNADNSNRYAVVESIYDECKNVVKCENCDGISVELKYPLKVKLFNSKKKFGDFMLCGAEPLTIVSERVVDFFENEGLEFEKKYILIYDRENHLLKDIPTYYVVRAKKILELDTKKMGVEMIVCPTCDKAEFSKDSWDIEKTYLSIKKDNSVPDLFMIRHWGNVLFVNSKLLKKIYKQKFTNISVRKGSEFFDIINSKTYNNKEISQLLNE